MLVDFDPADGHPDQFLYFMAQLLYFMAQRAWSCRSLFFSRFPGVRTRCTPEAPEKSKKTFGRGGQDAKDAKGSLLPGLYVPCQLAKHLDNRLCKPHATSHSASKKDSLMENGCICCLRTAGPGWFTLSKHPEKSHPAARKIRQKKDIPNSCTFVRSGDVWFLSLLLRGFFVCDGIRRLAMLCTFFGIRLSGSMPPIRRVRIG